MRKTITTIILFLTLILLLLGVIVLGSAIYTYTTGSKLSQSMYMLNTIATEVPKDTTNKVIANSNQSISQSIQGVEQSAGGKNESSTYKNEISKYFYNQLSKNQKILYEGLEENKQKLKQGNYVINFGETFSELLNQEGGSEQLGDDYQTAIEAFMHDNPDVFYLDVNKMYLNIETTTRFLKTTHKVYISAAQGATYLSDNFNNTSIIEEAIIEVENVKEQILNKISGNDYQKILYIHDYLVENIEYDSTYNQIGSYSIYGALVGKKCVCEGYAKAFKYLLNAIGIKCEIMQGTATNSSGQTESHAWNCVEIGGVWYEVDVTWDDPILVNGGWLLNSSKYRYFLKGTGTFEKDHILSYQFSEGGKNFSYPTISVKDYD